MAATDDREGPVTNGRSHGRDPSEAFGRTDDLGTLEQGKSADLLILDADPLADAANNRRFSAVIKDGAVIDRDVLPSKRDASVPDERPVTKDKNDVEPSVVKVTTP
ncbi:amidohydrolase family protein [Paenarthrobacter sp. NPDC091669]|uniref:amidohydrolase family protein n=1 Tax=Paenarthrobacter sp. NPDC091669 TaxID=3364384 RepID=UPI0037F13130